MQKIKPVEKIRTIIDELAEVNGEFKELGDRKKDLETLLKKYFEQKDLDKEEEYIFVGEAFQCDLGQVGMKRTITDMKKVRKFLGEKPFMELATIKLKDIDSYLSAEQQEEVIKEERAGSRVMKFSEAPVKSNLKKTKTKTKSKNTKTKVKDDFEF